MLRSDPTHEDFNGFDKPGCVALENILIAYSNFDKEIGYVQGLNYLVSQILKYTRKLVILKNQNTLES